MKNLILKGFLFLIAVTIGCVVSNYIFNDLRLPWLGFLSYGIVVVLSIIFIINQIKQYTK